MVRSIDKDGGSRERERAVALVSGGLDSVVSLAIADRELEIRLVLFCNYGQLAMPKERASVVEIATYYGLPFREVDVGWLRDLSPEGLRGPAETRSVGGGDPTSALPREGTDSLDSLDAVWVPNRNGVFLSVAAAFAERYGCGVVVTGFNREEAAEFPDNSPEYVDAVNRGLEFSTRGGVRVISYTLSLTKREILRRGLEIGVPLEAIWSCYRGGERMCGSCGSCRRLKSAIESMPDERRPFIEFQS